MDAKAQAILKIFLRYPSLMGLPLSEKQGMTAAYLDDCLDLTADEIAAGYERFRRAGSPFPPSGPELRKCALDARADRIAKQRAAAPRLQAPPRGIDAVPEADRAAMRARFAELLSSLRTGTAQ